MDFNSLHLIGNAHAELLLLLIIRSWEVLYAKTRHFWNLYAHNQNLSLDSKLTDKGKVISLKRMLVSQALLSVTLIQFYLTKGKQLSF